MSRIPLPFVPPRPAALAMGAREWSLLGLLSVLWGGSFFFVSVAVVDRPWTLAPPGWPVAAAVVGLAVVSTAVAYIVYFRLLERAGASNSLLVTLMIPVSAILLGGLFLGERLEPATLAGMVLIAVGLAVLDGRPLRLLRRITP